ncbi:MAG: glycosyltransferase family 39 protein [Lachnospiraceae bacterium]|nr:glycosyltransferase family 39 protein [Lachnospiraceae bacterium]
MKKAGEIFEKYNPVFLLILLAGYLFSRVFMAGEIPYYLHTKELEQAYESLCIARFGTDSTGAAPSLFFGGFGDGHSPLFIWAGALLMKLRPALFSMKLFRLISAAGGFFAMIFSYLFVWQWTGKKKDGFVAAGLVLSLPIFFISQRNFLENFLVLSILPAAFFFLLAAIKKSKALLFLLSGILFSAAVLTWRPGCIIIPLFALIVCAYLFFVKKIRIRDAVLLCVPVLICAVLIVISGLKLDVNPAGILKNLTRFKKMFWDDGHDFNVIPDFGTMYVFSLPLLVTGVIVSFKKVLTSVKTKTFDASVLAWCFVIAGLPVCLIIKKAGLSTACGLFFALAMLIMEGIIYIGDNVKGTLPVIVLVYIVGFCILTHYYLVNYNSELNHSSDHENGNIVDKSAGEAVKAALKMYPEKTVTVYTGEFEGRNLLIALYGAASPADYRQFSDASSFSFNNVEVNPEGDIDYSPDHIYAVDQYERPDLVDAFTNQGWGVTVLKEFVLFYVN